MSVDSIKADKKELRLITSDQSKLRSNNIRSGWA